MEEEILVRCFLVYTCFQLTTHQFSKKWVPFRWKVVCCKLVTAIVKLIYGWASPVHLVLLGNLWLLECPLPQLTCRPCFLSCGISFSLSSFSAIKHINVLAMSGPSPLIEKAVDRNWQSCLEVKKNSHKIPWPCFRFQCWMRSCSLGKREGRCVQTSPLPQEKIDFFLREGRHLYTG